MKYIIFFTNYDVYNILFDVINYDIILYRLNKKQSQNKNTEDNPDSELPNSLEIIANMDIGNL